MLLVLLPSLTLTRVNSLMNDAILESIPSQTMLYSSQFPYDAIQYGTHGMHSASQFHKRYNAVRIIRAWQDPHKR